MTNNVHQPSEPSEIPLSVISKVSASEPPEQASMGLTYPPGSPMMLEETTPSRPANPSSTPSVLEAAAPSKANQVPGNKNTLYRRGRRALRRIVVNVQAAIWIFFVYGIPGVLLSTIFLVLILASILGPATVVGVVVLLSGNAILRAARHPHYTTDAVAAKIGAVGAPISALIIMIAFACIPRNVDRKIWWPLSWITSVLAGTLTGVIGLSILGLHSVDLHGIDALHAARAGALGGTIFGPAADIAICAALSILVSPLFIAAKLGLRWVYVRSYESWNERGTHRLAYCACYTTSGGDPDIEEELEEVRRMERTSEMMMQIPVVNHEPFDGWIWS